MTFTKKITSVDNISLAYITAGKGHPVLFLHGGGLNAMTYAKNIELLAKNYLVIVPDIPCFGKSGVPNQTWDFENYAKFFSKFINKLNLKKVFVIGHSFGGGIAIELAATDARIITLTLVDSSGITPHYSYTTFFYLLMNKTFRSFINFKKKFTVLRIALIFLWDRLKKILHLPQILKTTLHATYTTSKNLNKIKQPTFIIWGKTDHIFPKEYAQKLHQNISTSTLKYTLGNHDWLIIFPEKFVSFFNKKHAPRLK